MAMRFVVRLPVPGLPWRLFAVPLVVFAAPIMIEGLGMEGNNTARNSAFGLVALVGTLGYAFGFRIGPIVFWRAFSFVFALGLMTRLGARFIPLFATFQGQPISARHSPFVLGIGLVIALLLVVALFRHAELVLPHEKKKTKDELAEVFS